MRVAIAALAALGVAAGVLVWFASNLRVARSNVVVLYSSVDRYVLDEVLPRFEERTGLRVELVGDTEATKTTGLVARLLAERDAPKADVWWSSEPFGTIRLAEEGVLRPFWSDDAEAAFDGGWPSHLRAADSTWYGFAQRARVIVYSEDRVDEPPTTLAELTGEAWRGRVGMARPQFGTTRGHMAALYVTWGEAAFRAWLDAMESNGLRLYDGNASVVRAIALGEIDAGLTDTDDVWAAREQGMPVSMVYEAHDAAASPPSIGPMVIPNTVAVVEGGPWPALGERLAEFLLSPEVERIIAESDSRNAPVHPSLAAEFPDLVPGDAASVNLAEVAAAMPDAMRVCDEELGG